MELVVLAVVALDLAMELELGQRTLGVVAVLMRLVGLVLLFFAIQILLQLLLVLVLQEALQQSALTK
jgi:hypothetical protein